MNWVAQKLRLTPQHSKVSFAYNSLTRFHYVFPTRCSMRYLRSMRYLLWILLVIVSPLAIAQDAGQAPQPTRAEAEQLDSRRRPTG